MFRPRHLLSCPAYLRQPQPYPPVWSRRTGRKPSSVTRSRILSPIRSMYHQPQSKTFPFFARARLCVRTATPATPFLSIAYFTVLCIPRWWGALLIPRHSSLATIFPAINTCETTSKQTTLTIFRMSVYAKPGGPLSFLTAAWDSQSWLSSGKFQARLVFLSRPGMPTVRLLAFRRVEKSAGVKPS